MHNNFLNIIYILFNIIPPPFFFSISILFIVVVEY